jgi:hypothetical protein
MKAPLRTKSIGTKVSEEEFAALEECARQADMTLSEWVRAVLLAAPGVELPGNEAAGEAALASRVTLAEVLALRTLFLNLQFRQAQGPMTEAEMRGLIERADGVKGDRARERIEAARSQARKQAGVVPRQISIRRRNDLRLTVKCKAMPSERLAGREIGGGLKIVRARETITRRIAVGPQTHLSIVFSDGIESDRSQNFRRPCRTDDAGRRASAWRRPSHSASRPLSLFGQPEFPCQGRDACGPRGSSGCTHS